MKRIVLGIVMVLVAGICWGQTQQVVVAVSPFEYRTGIAQEDAEALYELFASELITNGTIKVVDRSSFDRIIAEMRFQMSDWSNNEDVPGTSGAIGAGKRNTEVIIAYLRQIRETGKAAQLCDALVFDGYSDWFLPSKEELNLMYTNLKAKGLGNFQNNWYWSSSQRYSNYSWLQSFSDGSQNDYLKNRAGCVRAVRAF